VSVSTWVLPYGDSVNGTRLALAGNVVYATAPGEHRVLVYDLQGRVIGGWGGPGAATGQFRIPTGITVDAAGNIYVADTYNSRLQKFGARQ
jgi:DNA-binding beta-propeller fold protein YncE